MPLLKSNDFWKPNTYYYSTERYKSLIEYDNTLYICTMSHLSGDVFDETKFNVVSGSEGSGGLTESQVNTLIDTKLTDFTPSGGGGFSFGGDWDATPTETLEIAGFNVLQNATASSNQLTVTSGVVFGATATNLSHNGNTGTLREFRITVPDTSGGGLFFVGIHNSREENVFSTTSDTTATVRGVIIDGGYVFSFIRNTDNASSTPLPYTVDAGDVLKVGYRSDTSAVYIYNETKSNMQLIGESAISGFSDGLENLTVFSSVAGSSLSFDFADDYPIYQAIFNFDYPDDLTKTYRVSTATTNSIINNKLLKANDFVNFITQGDDVVDIVISRLMTDAQIKTLTDTAIYDYLDNEQSDVDSNLSLYIKNLIQTELQDTNSSIYQAATYLTQEVITTETQSTGIIDNLMTSALSAAGLIDGMSNIVSVQDVIGQECQSGGIIDNAIQSSVNL